MEDSLLPLYRALRSAGAEDVTFLAYHAGHSFSTARDRIHEDLVEWIYRGPVEPHAPPRLMYF